MAGDPARPARIAAQTGPGGRRQTLFFVYLGRRPRPCDSQKVHGNSYQALHPSGSYYELNTYPVRAVKAAGGILTAGSDAPVETNDPRPFINISRAITRGYPGQPALSPQQGITVREAIDAYTINGARMLNLQAQAGSIEVGKSADFIVVDQDILALADDGHPEQIARTHVLGTWFQGKQAYTRPVTR